MALPSTSTQSSSNPKVEAVLSAIKALLTKDSPLLSTMTITAVKFEGFSAATVIIGSLVDTETETYYGEWPTT